MAKLRPQGSDAWPVARDWRRVFIGWAPWKKGAVPGCDRLSERMLDLAELDGGWNPALLAAGINGRRVSAHRKLAHEIDEGSMVTVPRPEAGVVHLAPVTARFELVDSPPWLDDYLKLRKRQGLSTEPAYAHAGDVCQTWPTGEWRTVPFPFVPGWIVRTLISRNQICRLKKRPDGRQAALDALRSLYEDGDVSRLFESETRSADIASTVRSRLQTWLTPRSFEQFCCDLLQVHQPERTWWPVGGSGDAGTDAIAIDHSGTMVAVLQCKYSFSGSAARLGESLRERLATRWGRDVDVYVATLFRDHSQAEDPRVFCLGPGRLTEMLLERWDEVPAARRLDVSLGDQRLHE